MKSSEEKVLYEFTRICRTHHLPVFLFAFRWDDEKTIKPGNKIICVGFGGLHMGSNINRMELEDENEWIIKY